MEYLIVPDLGRGIVCAVHRGRTGDNAVILARALRTHNRVRACAGSFVRKAGLPQSGIKRFLGECQVSRIAKEGLKAAQCSQRVDLRFQPVQFGQGHACLIEIAPEAERAREIRMNIIKPRVSGPRFLEQVYGLVDMTEKKMANT